MKKTHLLSVLALGISAPAMPKHIQPLLDLHNLTLAAWACCKRRQRVWRVKGR